MSGRHSFKANALTHSVALLLTYEKLFPSLQAIGGNWFSLSLDKKEYSQIRLHEIGARSTGVVLPKMAHVT